MIALHIEKIKDVQNDFLIPIEKQRTSALTKLIAVRGSKMKFDIHESNYLDLVINLFQEPEVLMSTPQEITAHKIPIPVLPANSCPARKKYPLKKIIQDCLNYTYLRKSFYPKYFNSIGIKACVYCNSELTISIEESNSKYSARFDVDHFEPKDEFPYLSIFLFNLYPSCASCNRRKSKSTSIDFQLYSDDLNDTKTSIFKFKFDSSSKSRYLISKDIDDLKFSFQPLSNVLQSELKIEEIYNTQKDIIAELIVKNAMYDKYNRINLKNNFSKLSLHPDLYLRALIGNYTRESEIHKRPMAKFMQDISKDLGLLD